MTSSISGTTNRSGVSGLVSGMNTDELVKAALAKDTAKIEKYKANLQIDEWKTEAYRDITSSLQSFYKTYFDSTSSLNLKSANSFASFATTYGNTTSTNYVTVTGLSGATAKDYSIKKLVTATAATLSGGDVSKDIIGTEILDSDVANISSANGNNVLSITLNGITKQIALNSGGTITTVAGLQAEMQTKINEAFGENKLTVTNTATATGGKLSFSTVRSTDSFSIDKVYNEGSSTLFSSAPTVESPLVLNAYNNKFKLTIGGATETVTVPLGGGSTKAFVNADELADAIQAAANDAFGGTADITFTNTDGKVTYTSGQSVAIAQTELGTNAALGFGTSNLSNKLDLNAKISDLKNSFDTALNTSGNSNDIIFSINGIGFNFSSASTSIQDILNTVNGNTKTNATMKYNTTTNSFTIKSNNTGSTDEVVVSDITGNLMSALGIAGTDKGTDASVTLDDGTEIVRESNSFTYDGINYNIKQNFTAGTDADGKVTDPIVATVSSDTTKAYEYIKGFIDKYNEIIDKINEKTSEKRYRDYAPLTAEQKEAMSEDQVKQWETKAKSGLLRNDSILSSIVTELRSTLYDAVEGTGISLSAIGITTSSDYTKRGKLEITPENETKLKNALATKADQITKLFTNSSNTTYYEAINSSTAKSKRYKESGIAQRLSDIIQNAIRTNTDNNGNKGMLLDKAGIVGDRSEYTNLLFKEMASFDEIISNLNDRLSSKENALYAKYAAMESALSKLNDQQSYITQMLGSK